MPWLHCSRKKELSWKPQEMHLFTRYQILNNPLYYIDIWDPFSFHFLNIELHKESNNVDSINKLLDKSKNLVSIRSQKTFFSEKEKILVQIWKNELGPILFFYFKWKKKYWEKLLMIIFFFFFKFIKEDLAWEFYWKSSGILLFTKC